MAEIIFGNLCVKNKKTGIVIKSAGTHAAGLMTFEAGVALRESGEKLPRRKMKATQFASRMITEYDYIVCMTRKHKQFIGDSPNVKSLDELTGSGDIPDPFGWPLDVYIEVCKKLQKELGLLYNAVFKSLGSVSNVNSDN